MRKTTLELYAAVEYAEEVGNPLFADKAVWVSEDEVKALEAKIQTLQKTASLTEKKVGGQ